MNAEIVKEQKNGQKNCFYVFNLTQHNWVYMKIY